MSSWLRFDTGYLEEIRQRAAHCCEATLRQRNVVPQWHASISASPHDVKSLKSFVRRLLVVKVASAFTSDPAVLDPKQRVFLEDPTL